MRTRNWRFGVAMLCALILFPLGETIVAADALEFNLVWYDPLTGKLKGNNDPKSTDASQIPVPFLIPLDNQCGGKIECKIGDVVLEDDCNGIDPGKVKANGKKFVVDGSIPAEVLCFDKDEKPFTAGDPKDATTCRLKKADVVRMWKEIFDPGVKDKKAIPWVAPGTKAYCPDPMLYSDAYDLDSSVTDAPTNEIVRRSTLDACARVIEGYLNSCAGASGKSGTEIKNLQRDKEGKLLELKMEMAKKWTIEDDCETEVNWWESKDSENECNYYWNSAKKHSEKDVQGIKKSTVTLQGASYDKIREAYTDEIAAAWESGTLDTFLGNQAIGAYKILKPDGAEDFDKAYSGFEQGEKDIQLIIDFLRKRSDNLNIVNAISQTKTLKVSELLRRNSKSNETKLTITREDDGDSINIFNKIIKLITQVFGALGVLLLIISGVMMVISRGEETMLQKAKQTFIYTLIGLVIGFLSYTIVRFILELLLMR